MRKRQKCRCSLLLAHEHVQARSHRKLTHLNVLHRLRREKELEERERAAAERAAKALAEQQLIQAELETKRLKAMRMAQESARRLQEQLEAQEAEKRQRQEREAAAAAAEEEARRLESEKVAQREALIYDDSETPDGQATTDAENPAGTGSIDEQEDSTGGATGKERFRQKKGKGPRRAGSVKRLANAMADDLAIVTKRQSASMTSDGSMSPLSPLPVCMMRTG